MSDTAHERIRYLHVSRGCFYFRRRVPTQLKWAFDGRSILEVPLPKLPPAQLAKLIEQHNQAFERTVTSAKARGGPGADRPMRESDIPKLAQAYEACLLHADDELRSEGLPESEFTELESLLAEGLTQRQMGRARGQFDALRESAVEFLSGAGLAPPSEPTLLRRLLQAIHDADQRATAAALARNRGDIVPTPPMPTGPGVYEGQGVAGPHGYFDEMYRLWSRRSGSTYVTRNEAEVWLRRLAEFSSTDPSAFMETLETRRPVNPDVVGRRLHLLDMPRSRVMEFKNHWLEIAERRATTGEGPRISPKTVRKGLSMLAAIVGMSLHEYPANDQLQTNVFHHLWRKTERKAETLLKPRTAFEVDQLNALYSSRLYCQGPSAYDPMEVSMYWLFLAGTFTGARLEELAHLEPNDVYQAQGLWWLRIEAKSTTQRLKTAASERDVPVHATLVDAGFVAYAKAAKAAGWKRLFPWLKETKRGGVSAAISKRLNRYLDEVGLDSRRLAFHSLRHTFKHFARLCDIQTEAVDALVGHSGKDGVSAKYGADRFPRQTLLRSMGQFDIPGLDLRHVLLPEDAGGSHVQLAQAALTRGKTKAGRWKGPSKLPRFLQRDVLTSDREGGAR